MDRPKKRSRLILFQKNSTQRKKERKMKKRLRRSACINCHKSHRKCDEERPCSNCKKTSVDCIDFSNFKIATNVSWLSQNMMIREKDALIYNDQQKNQVIYANGKSNSMPESQGFRPLEAEIKPIILDDSNNLLQYFSEFEKILNQKEESEKRDLKRLKQENENLRQELRKLRDEEKEEKKEIEKIKENGRKESSKNESSKNFNSIHSFLPTIAKKAGTIFFWNSFDKNAPDTNFHCGFQKIIHTSTQSALLLRTTPQKLIGNNFSLFLVKDEGRDQEKKSVVRNIIFYFFFFKLDSIHFLL